MTCKLKYRHRILVQNQYKGTNISKKSEINGSYTETLILFAATLNVMQSASKNSHEFVKKKNHDKNVVMIIPADENPYII